MKSKAGGSSGLLMDLTANEKAVHADFFNGLRCISNVCWMIYIYIFRFWGSLWWWRLTLITSNLYQKVLSIDLVLKLLINLK